MSVYKRASNGKWMADVTYKHLDGTVEEIRRVSRVQTKKGAEKLEHQLIQSLSDGTFGKKKRESPLFEAFAKDFLASYAKVNNKPSTVRGKEKNLRVHLIPFFGKMRLNEVGLKDVERYKARKKEEGLSPKSINNHLTVLHKLLDVAVEWEALDQSIRMRWMKVPEQQFDFLSSEEAESLVKGAHEDWRTMIIVAMHTGLRQGELLELRWGDISFDRKSLRVSRSIHRGHIGSPKNGRIREITLNPVVLDALRKHRHLRSELVFCNEKGEHLTDSQCKRPLYAACRRAGLGRNIGWHVLRHTFASHLAMRNAPVKTIQELMGHADIRQTMRYMHLSPSAKKDAVDLLVQPNQSNTDQFWGTSGATR